MVDVAQSVRVTDCGSEGRGFESHLPPLKQARRCRVIDIFLFFTQRLQRGAMGVISPCFSLYIPQNLEFFRVLAIFVVWLYAIMNV